MPYTREQKRAYDARPENRAKKRAWSNARWAALPEAEKEACRAKRRAQYAEWRATASAEEIAAKRARTRKYNRLANGIKDAPSEMRSGPCEICRVHHDALHCDHDHSTGEVRGWLCLRCNAGLGQLNDSVERLLSAVAYLSSRR